MKISPAQAIVVCYEIFTLSYDRAIAELIALGHNESDAIAMLSHESSAAQSDFSDQTAISDSERVALLA